MTEAIYKVGDILEFTEVVPRQFGLWTGPVRGLVVKISDPGYEYLSYRLLLSGTAGTTKNITLCCAFEKDIIPAAKRVGHIDISALMFMENDEPDYEKMVTAYAVIKATNLRKLLDEETLKRKQAEAECEEKAKENVRLSYENSDLKALNDELRKSMPEYNKLVLKYSACTEKIKELEEENKALSDTLSKSGAKAHSRLDRNEVLKKENEEVRGYNKELEQALENERLSNAQRYLDLSNENKELKAEYYACTEKIKELENENARYFQSMTCVEKQLNEATKRIHAAMEHLDVAVYRNE